MCRRGRARPPHPGGVQRRLQCRAPSFGLQSTHSARRSSSPRGAQAARGRRQRRCLANLRTLILQLTLTGLAGWLAGWLAGLQWGAVAGRSFPGKPMRIYWLACYKQNVGCSDHPVASFKLCSTPTPTPAAVVVVHVCNFSVCFSYPGLPTKSPAAVLD